MQNWQPRSTAPVYGKSPGSYAGPVNGVYGSPYARYPDQVQQLNYRYAPFGVRFGAHFIQALIDFGALVVIVILAWIAYLALGLSDSENSAVTFRQLEEVIMVVPLIWNIGLVACGGTLGQRLFGLRVTVADGKAPGFMRACIRQLWMIVACASILFITWSKTIPDGESLVAAGRMVTKLSFGLYFLGCFGNIFTGHKQALHDKLAGTYVIQKRQNW